MDGIWTFILVDISLTQHINHLQKSVKPMKIIVQLWLIFLAGVANAQTGIIKGKVIDKQSEIPLVGATIELLNSKAAKGTVTDKEGFYSLQNVSLGRQTIRISYIGFETVIIPNIIVTSGKDAIVSTALIESFNTLSGVVVSGKRAKDRPINSSSTVSARQFGLEEVTRFSGGRGDVGRLAANFAWVSAPDDSRNDIVVRGNSPVGLLWRLEGVPIPNPNHFSAFGSTGGPVSAINPNILKDSDFLTSAFPAEYGNALGGVFDLGFRTGNRDDYEYTLQAGAFSGLEAMAEGPLGKDNGSFLVAARYSLVGLIGAGAGGASVATPNYADISFNLDLGATTFGNFSVFGILGDSKIDFLGDAVDDEDLFAAEDEDLFVKSSFGVLGVKHSIIIGDKSYLKTIVSGSFSNGSINADRFIDKDTPEERQILYSESENAENRFTFSTLFNSKLSTKNSLRTGVLLERFGVASLLRDREGIADTNGDGDPDLFSYIDSDKNLIIVQPYVQGQFRFTEKLTINTGLHSQYSTLNEQFVVEPRVGLTYKILAKHSLSLGYGLHHQPVAFPILFLNEELNGALVQTNRELDFVRSNHYVFGYDLQLDTDWRAKFEVYYQDISNAAVEPTPSSYSSLTEGADFQFDNNRVSLINEGTGFNRGIELTLEKFFSKGYYGLLTTSLFESRYVGSDGIERNSPFNNRYVVNFLSGKEFGLGITKKNVLFFDTRVTVSGGRYFTPIDLAASVQSGFEVLQENLAFSEQYDAYFRWDFKFGIRLNSATKKRSHQIYFDFQNVTNRENVFVRRYNRLTNSINQVNQIGFFPDFGYRLQF